MIDRELMLESTESYLRSVISEVSGLATTDFDIFAPFGELGVDSFHVLEIVKKLETDFGTLPKTLLFENFNINDLANYFVNEHEQVLVAKFSSESNNITGSAVKPGPKSNTTAKLTVANVTQAEQPKMSPLARSSDIASQKANEPILILEKSAYAHPVLGEVVRTIFEKYRNEGSASRGTRTIAPNIFLGAERRGYINYARHKDIVLAYSYTGPEDYFTPLVEEFLQYCENTGSEFNLLSGNQIESLSNVLISSTPFGVVQKIVNIQDFSLKGGKMRRLRYLVSKFNNAGECRTEEYRCGSDSKIDQDIARVIDQWCAGKSMVNPLIQIVKEEILDGSLNPEHRLFITYLDDVLQNVILISPVSTESGYLMDLEFYPKEMPLGGLEYAITSIIQTLAAEGNSMLSMGGTYGCKLAPSSNADVALDKILDHLREKEIFNDGGNMQFKNKFRPENRSVYICRKVEGSNPNNITDIIMMIADPARMQTSDEENHTKEQFINKAHVSSELSQPIQAHSQEHSVDTENKGLILVNEPRSQVLASHGYNALNVPSQYVDFDLKTDSWAQQTLPAIDQQMGQVYQIFQQPAKTNQDLKDIFPFEHFVFADSGRAAEHLFFKAYHTKGTVLQNILFPTTIFHQIDNGFTPKELPCAEIFDLDSEEFYQGHLNIDQLQACLENDLEATELVYVELTNNASGGRPVSLHHLKKIKALLAKYSIPLILDGTRVVENAQLIVEHEKEHIDDNVWDLVRDILSCADGMVASLPKDFCVDRGGLIATNDVDLFDKIQKIVDVEGSGLDVIDNKVIDHCLKRQKLIEHQVRQKMASVRQVHTALKGQGVPVNTFAGGHCIVIDVAKIKEFNNFQDPVASFVSWMYLNTGIRCGAHSVGKQKGTTLNKLVRLAIPIGLESKEIDEIVQRLTVLFEHKQNIPEVVRLAGADSSFADINANYELLNYHSPSSEVILMSAGSSEGSEHRIDDCSDSVSLSATHDDEAVTAKPAVEDRLAAAKDIAIVGMAGRYPKAKNLEELWDNLVEGKDCIEDIPEERLQQRLNHSDDSSYRGGFIDDVDRFDAPFFNVSDQEAIMLDPQERIFLEVCWEALEDGGYYPEILANEGEPRNVGVYVGAVWSMYQMLGLEEKFSGNNVSPNSFFWSIANRVSFWMNLCGPSLTLDTACSSSLTSVNLACEAIARGECSMALVGGVNLDLHRSKFEINSIGGTLSKDGKCRSFGRGADGYVSGEGVGVLVLKPLEQAVNDNDNIHGVIKSAVVNHSGRTSGYTRPSSAPQTNLILRALTDANINAESIGYIEAHGTATDLGDAIEIDGLNKAYKSYQVEKRSCPIGSVKTNIGHLEAASGVVGIQKILLQMKHRKLVPSLHSENLNQTIDFETSPFYVMQKTSDWQQTEVEGIPLPLRAGISAFGAGGANAHVILEQYQTESVDSNSELAEYVFPLSAKTTEQLRGSAIRLKEFIKRDVSLTDPVAPLRLNDVSYTLRQGRISFDYRLAVIAKSKNDLVEKLDCFVEGRNDEKVFSGHVKTADKVTDLLNRREKREFIEMLSQSSDLSRLSQLWSDGLLVDWSSVEVGGYGRKVSLPTYPFANNRYWISTTESRADALSAIPRRDSENVVVKPVAEPSVPSGVQPPNGAARSDDKVKIAEVFEFSLAAAEEDKDDQSLTLSTEDKSELFVKKLFSEKLNVPIADVSLVCQLMETGVTSIDMAEMTTSIKSELAPDFSPTAFFECTTLRSLSEQLLLQYEPVFQEMRVIKRTVQSEKGQNENYHNGSGQVAALPASDVDTAIVSVPLHLQDAESDVPKSRLKKKFIADDDPLSCVLLTGATGFFGIHILTEILHTHDKAKVFCLVRSTDQQQGLQRLLDQARDYELSFDESRVVILCGDLEQPKLGLKKQEWDNCSRQVRQIIHASAHVNHIEGYATFRDSVRGMKEIIRLAGSRRRKLIQFISSISACMHKVGDEFSIYEREDFIENGEVVFGGYGQSKWVQESFLKKAHDDSQIPYLIYRFGELSGSSESGLGKTDDMLHRLLQMRLAVGCKEKISSDVLDMLPVNFAAKLIVNGGSKSDIYNRVIHATHTKPYSFANLYRQVEPDGLSFDPVTREDYLNRCYDFVNYISSIDPVNGFVLECVLRDTEGSSRNLKAMDGYFALLFPFDQNNFTQTLKETELVLPDWNTLFDRYLTRWKEPQSGFMETIFDYQAWSQLNKTDKPASLSNHSSLGKAQAPKTRKGKPIVETIAQD